MTADFASPVWLWLAPLALLPFRRRREDALMFGSLLWLPANQLGRWFDWVWRSLAALMMTGIVVGLAEPGITGDKKRLIGEGAEVMIMLDRSSSMDAVPRARVGSAAGPTVGQRSSGLSKNQVARQLLTEFVMSRPNERFALMTFSTQPMLVAGFADHNAAVLSGLEATGIGRGLPKTDMGLALLSSIKAFENRSYSGSRVILIVSDGGAKLDDATQRAIREGLATHNISLYFIYLRSTGSPADLNAPAENAVTRVGEETLLHRYFLSLSTPYSLFQAEDPESMAKALETIDREHNEPLIYYERVPRRSVSGWFFGFAFVAGLLLMFAQSFQVRGWHEAPDS